MPSANPAAWESVLQVAGKASALALGIDLDRLLACHRTPPSLLSPIDVSVRPGSVQSDPSSSDTKMANNFNVFPGDYFQLAHLHAAKDGRQSSANMREAQRMTSSPDKSP
jgi:hypothetical protein